MILPEQRIEPIALLLLFFRVFCLYFNKFFIFAAIDDSGTETTAANISTVQETLPNAKVGDKVAKVTVPSYFCPIVKLTSDGDSEDEAAALTIYLKRDTNVETERNTLSRTTDISADKIYTAGLSNQSKVVLAKIKK